MRLIDADALLAQVTEEKREAPNWDYAVGYCDAIKRVQCMIGEAPTVAEDNNVPCKPSDRCGCGGKAILTDYTVEGALKIDAALYEELKGRVDVAPGPDSIREGKNAPSD